MMDTSTERQKETIKILELLIEKTKENSSFSVCGVTYDNKNKTSGIFGGINVNDISLLQSTISMLDVYKTMLVEQLTKLCFTKENNEN